MANEQRNQEERGGQRRDDEKIRREQDDKGSQRRDDEEIRPDQDESEREFGQQNLKR